MRIGEVADRSGVSPTTIRYYEDIGLLREPDRTSAGYRDYTDAAIARLTFIRAAQSIGLSLGEIREVLALKEQGETPCPHVIALLEQRSAELTERIAALELMRNDLIGLAQRARRRPLRDDADFCHIIETARRS